MEKDHLEKFIENHRKGFDDKEPSAELWQNITKELPASKRRLWRNAKLSGIAASIMLLLFVGFRLGQQSNSQPYALELQEIEKYYNKEIGDRMTQVANFGGVENLEDDLDQLDVVFKDLKEELIHSKYGNNEKLVNALIENYKTKINVLETVLEKLNNNKEENLLNDEGINL